MVSQFRSAAALQKTPDSGKYFSCCDMLENLKKKKNHNFKNNNKKPNNNLKPTHFGTSFMRFITLTPSWIQTFAPLSRAVRKRRTARGALLPAQPRHSLSPPGPKRESTQRKQSPTPLRRSYKSGMKPRSLSPTGRRFRRSSRPGGRLAATRWDERLPAQQRLPVRLVYFAARLFLHAFDHRGQFRPDWAEE